MNELLAIILLSNNQYGYNPEYENLSEEEKVYMDYVDECLNETDEKFNDACMQIILFLLKISSKIEKKEEVMLEEIILQKEKLLSNFSQKDKERLELFMYACTQTIGIYSEERVKKRKK